MSTLTIKDLSIAADMNGKAMNEVRGGFYGGWKMPSLVAEHPASSSTTITVKQGNSQSQNNPTGNGSVTFGGDISAANNQQAFNVVGGAPFPIGEMLRF